MPLQRPERGEVLVQRRLRRYALGLAFRIDSAGIDAAGKPREPQPFGSEPVHQRGLVGALQVGDGAKALARDPGARGREHFPLNPRRALSAA
jgi:hypothetical protein